MMNCEEFELRGLDLDRPDADPGSGREAAKHATCLRTLQRDAGIVARSERRLAAVA